ncbi:MAG: hypothetical protein ACFHU9_10970 [Fluviicola sp.]
MNKLSFLLIPFLGLISCNESTSTIEEKISYKNKGHELVAKMTEKVGRYKDLREKKDVTYTYRYETPDGKVDLSTEKYLFNGELSYARYHRHDRTFPESDGDIEMAYDGKEYWLKLGNELVSDPLKIDVVKFKRPTNFYWFAMFQKLLSPGVNYEYLGEKQLNNTAYEIVKITYESKNDKPTDIYQLYINKETHLVDQFLFTVVDYDIVDTPFLMKLEYEKIEGMLIPTKRRYKKSTWDAVVTDEPWILVNWTDIKFNNGLTKEDFHKG